MFFSGLVQGVGFRFKALDLAKQHNLKGWVKNLEDGRVEILAQGLEKDLNLFLDSLNREFKPGIADCQVEESENSKDLSGFKIIF